MSKAATNEELALLHKEVATSLAADLKDAESIEDPAVRIAARRDARAQAITFLKNNSITAAKGDGELAELQAALAAKRKPSSKISQKSLDDMAADFGDRLQ